MEVAEKWCKIRRCEDDMNLLSESEAVRESLVHFPVLKIDGGVILIDGKVEAFTLGELLNDQTAVVHIEKADPENPGLYAVTISNSVKIAGERCSISIGDRIWVNLGLEGQTFLLSRPSCRKFSLKDKFYQRRKRFKPV